MYYWLHFPFMSNGVRPAATKQVRLGRCDNVIPILAAKQIKNALHQAGNLNNRSFVMMRLYT